MKHIMLPNLLVFLLYHGILPVSFLLWCYSKSRSKKSLDFLSEWNPDCCARCQGFLCNSKNKEKDYAKLQKSNPASPLSKAS